MIPNLKLSISLGRDNIRSLNFPVWLTPVFKNRRHQLLQALCCLFIVHHYIVNSEKSPLSLMGKRLGSLLQTPVYQGKCLVTMQLFKKHQYHAVIWHPAFPMSTASAPNNGGSHIDLPSIVSFFKFSF